MLSNMPHSKNSPKQNSKNSNSPKQKRMVGVFAQIVPVKAQLSSGGMIVPAFKIKPTREFRKELNGYVTPNIAKFFRRFRFKEFLSFLEVEHMIKELQNHFHKLEVVKRGNHWDLQAEFMIQYMHPTRNNDYDRVNVEKRLIGPPRKLFFNDTVYGINTLKELQKEMQKLVQKELQAKSKSKTPIRKAKRVRKSPIRYRNLY
jgi:hypothetical protein